MSRAIGKPHPKDKFTPAEDAKLKILVSLFGVGCWNKISEKMGTRNPRQCRDRYKNYLAPNLNNSPWTIEDDIKLEQLVEKMGKKWSLIAKEFTGRTDINIKSRYSLLQRQHARDRENVSKQALAIPEPQTQFNFQFDFDLDQIQDFGDFELFPEFGF